MSTQNKKLGDVPNQFCDYMRTVNTRFNEICDLYLVGLSMDDVRYLTPMDLINLVPQTQYRHKLLMTIMVKRYLYREDEADLCSIGDEKTSNGTGLGTGSGSANTDCTGKKTTKSKNIINSSGCDFFENDSVSNYSHTSNNSNNSSNSGMKRHCKK